MKFQTIKFGKIWISLKTWGNKIGNEQKNEQTNKEEKEETKGKKKVEK